MKIIKWFDQYFEEFLMGVLLILMTVIMGIQVAFRYCFNSSLAWSEELVRYLFIWAGFISLSYCVKKKISIRITQFEMLMPEKVIEVLDVFRNIFLALFALYMVPFAWRYLEQCINNGSTSASMGIPMYWIQCAPLVGFVLVIFRLIQCTIECVQAMKRGEHVQ